MFNADSSFVLLQAALVAIIIAIAPTHVVADDKVPQDIQPRTGTTSADKQKVERLLEILETTAPRHQKPTDEERRKIVDAMRRHGKLRVAEAVPLIVERLDFYTHEPLLMSAFPSLEAQYPAIEVLMSLHLAEIMARGRQIKKLRSGESSDDVIFELSYQSHVVQSVFHMATKEPPTVYFGRNSRRLIENVFPNDEQWRKAVNRYIAENEKANPKGVNQLRKWRQPPQ